MIWKLFEENNDMVIRTGRDNGDPPIFFVGGLSKDFTVNSFASHLSLSPFEEMTSYSFVQAIRKKSLNNSLLLCKGKNIRDDEKEVFNR